jgi:RNA polymerase sigma-70 factor (ECF subfamily)
VWLGRLIVSLLPAEPEAKGMLALMLYAEARRAARRDAVGAYVPLERQDTSLWDDSLIRTAESLLHDANQSGPTGRYQLEAAIQSAHAARRLAGRDNWSAIVALYDHLYARTHSPVVILNRAVALAELEGAAAALAAIAPLAEDKRMQSYQPYWAALAHLRAGTGDRQGAITAFTIAIGLTTDPAVRTYLHGRITALRDG